jgi:signal transduction histidine kinase
MKTARETVRLVRVAGTLTWLMVGVPTAIQGVGRPEAFRVWLAGYLAFGALFSWSAARAGRPGALLSGALAAQAAAVIVMIATQCRGFEGTLLVLVAVQLGLFASRPVGLTWIALQTLGLGLGVAHHWSVRSAWVLSPPYLGFQVLAFLVLERLARETRARAELLHANAELVSTRGLLEESARLAERLRLARELHDAMGHHLAALSLNLEALTQEATRPPEALSTARTLVRRLLDDVESVIDATSREAGVDLSQALASLSAAIPRPRVHVDAAGLVLRDPARAHALLRCCQEIATNAVKHADAENLWITLQPVEGGVSLAARDDGVGEVAVVPGHGLTGMRARLEEAGGSLEVATAPGRGFTLRAHLPVDGVRVVPRTAA